MPRGLQHRWFTRLLLQYDIFINKTINETLDEMLNLRRDHALSNFVLSQKNYFILFRNI